MDRESPESWKTLCRTAHLMRDFAMHISGHIGMDKITVGHQRILSVVFERSDGVMLKEIAQALELTPGAISQSIDTLVRLGIVERVQDPDDRRAVRIRPTEQSNRKREEVHAGFNRIMDSVLRRYTKAERDVFETILQKLAAKAESELKGTSTSSRRIPYLEEV